MITLILIENKGNPDIQLPDWFFHEFRGDSRFIILPSGLSEDGVKRIRDEANALGKTFEKAPLSDFFSRKGGKDITLVDVSDVSAGCGDSVDRQSAEMLCSYLHPSVVTVYSPAPLLRNVSGEIVPDAYVIDELSFEEAESLLYYGAPMIDINSIYSALSHGAKVYLKSFEERGGTLISTKPSKKSSSRIVKGFAAIYGVSVLTLEGIGFKGVSGTVTRLSDACSAIGVSFLMIAQGASESAISVVVKDRDAAAAAMSINRAFEKDIVSGGTEPVKINNNNAIIAAVGDRITDSSVFISSFYEALSSMNVAVRLSTLTKGDNSICAVIKSGDVKKALSGLHAKFCLSKVTISMALIGAGNVGRELLSQIAGQQEELSRRGIDIRVRAIANSRKMLLSDIGVDLADWSGEFAKSECAMNVDRLVDFIDSDAYPNSLIVDCTSSDALPLKYAEWFERGIHVVTPNKKAGVTEYGYYTKLNETARQNGVMYLHEATVGAGLPVISTLNDLVRTGDKILGISGIFSGTLGYLFSKYDGRRPFSELVLEAKKAGYTENDPREDLSGMDVARKTIILAREMGIPADLKSLSVISLVPDSLRNVPYETFVERISEMDAGVRELFDGAASRGEVLRYTGEVNADGSCSVNLKGYPAEHIFAQTGGTDNVIIFKTSRYCRESLVVRGPGAGIEVTAGGVFADILRLCSYLGAGN